MKSSSAHIANLGCLWLITAFLWIPDFSNKSPVLFHTPTRENPYEKIIFPENITWGISSCDQNSEIDPNWHDSEANYWL